jgi:hypothetical protein
VEIGSTTQNSNAHSEQPNPMIVMIAVDQPIGHNFGTNLEGTNVPNPQEENDKLLRLLKSAKLRHHFVRLSAFGMANSVAEMLKQMEIALHGLVGRIQS